MVQHLILHKGFICRVTDGAPISEYPHVDSFTGKLAGIVDNDDKVCFIFNSEGEYELTRFYLARNQRPATRLLILLCSQLNSIKENAVTITSERGETEGYSWLRMSCPALNVTGEAPEFLSWEHIRHNPERINLILTALGLVVCDVNTDTGEVEAGTTDTEDGNTEQPAGETVVVEGLSSEVHGLSTRDTRSVSLVAGFPLAVYFGLSCYRGPADDTEMFNYVKRQIENSYGDCYMISRTFLTKNERTAFISGVESSLAGVNRYPVFIRNREHINELMQTYINSN